ncbi:hypothetical protein NU219Hw_g3769t1 [Hortaea werneckii]
MAITGKRLQLTLAVTGAIAWVLQGYDQALMNGTAVALYEVGAAIGALAMFFIGDWFGRKRPAVGAAVVVLIGVILQVASFDLAQLIVATSWLHALSQV